MLRRSGAAGFEGFDQCPTQFKAGGSAEHSDLEDQAVPFSVVVDDAFEPAKRTASNNHPRAVAKEGMCPEGGPAIQRDLNIAQLTFKRALIDDGNDPCDALCTIASISVIE